jgi:hypothetical protein
LLNRLSPDFKTIADWKLFGSSGVEGDEDKAVNFGFKTRAIRTF